MRSHGKRAFVFAAIVLSSSAAFADSGFVDTKHEETLTNGRATSDVVLKERRGQRLLVRLTTEERAPASRRAVIVDLLDRLTMVDMAPEGDR